MALSFRSLVFLCLLPFISSGQAINNTQQLFFEQPYALQRSDLSSITCIYKDIHHIMWFGTENGLYRYDGVNIRYFGHHNGDTNSLPSNTALQIAEGKDGSLWVALQAGIAEIDPTTLQCKIFNGFNNGLDANNYTNKICIDDAGDIWVGNNLGIFLFNKKKQKFLNVWNSKMPGDSLSKYVTSIICLNKDLIIASTFHDIIFLNKEDKTFKRLHIFNPVPPKDSSITSIFLDSKQKLWIGTWGGGIYNYDFTENKLSRINALQNIYNIPHFYITSFYETTLGRQRIIWAGTSVGMLKCTLNYNGNLESFDFITHNKNTEHSIIQGIITSAYLDSDGALWCAGEYGICKCFPFQNNFKFFNGLKGLVLDIQSLRINNAARYFISSWNSLTGTGLSVTDSIGNQVYENPNPHFTDKDDGKNISGEAKDKYNRIWISCMAGVSVVDNKFNVIHQWNKNTKGDNNLSYYRTSGIAIHNDTVWIINYHRGIDLFDLSFKKIKHYSCYDNSGLSDNLVSAFFNDSKGNLWICGNSELYKYVPGSAKFKSYSLVHEPGGCGPRDIAETKSGDLIIASMLGVIRFNPHTEKYSYTSSPLLEKEQRVWSLALDKNGEIWFLTEKHLVHYKSDENRFILYGQEDGLDVAIGMNALRTFNGTDFYICQYDQVIKFNCDSLSHPVTPPYLFVDIQVNDSNVYSDSNKGNLSLPYNKNKLQFEFTGVSYIKAAQNQYYYQLSDVDKQWNITYKNSVSYANLAPGNYTFKVKTVNYAGMWSEDKIIHFIITPPYWKTWWFTILSVITILSILFFIIRYITQRNLKERILRLEKETAVERERNRIAQDMHDDLGSGLTKIAILSEVVKKQMEQPEKAFEQLERISDSSRTLVDNLQDIIWMLNSKHDQLDSLAIYIREYATKYFEQSGISISFNYPPHIEPLKLGDEQRRNIFMAIKEALNNIVKHAGASEVNIAMSVAGNAINFVVTDNGIGFNMAEIRQFANGVKNMQSRMDQVKGSCSITSKPREGTTITFSLRA